MECCNKYVAGRTKKEYRALWNVNNKDKVKSGTKLCRYAQFPEGRAIMPSILEELLLARKTTRKMIPLETDEFMKNVLDKGIVA